ncbi:DUF3419 family protein [bacterium]|nr:DUF3419 family protein [bacterium]
MARVKFAVVREDPELEEELVRLLRAKAALVVASGGCTALTLAASFPDLEVTAFDRSAEQIAHVERKREALARGDLAALNVSDASPAGLNQSGEFDGLFRQLRLFVEEFVAPRAEIASFFEPGTTPRAREELIRRWVGSRYWPVAFSLHFHESLLHAMFGREATQHAAPGSYPAYFQRVFERGLAAAGAPKNPFLQHVFLGAYRPEDAPVYLKKGRANEIELVTGSLEHVSELERFSVFSLSNVFDWSTDELARSWAELLSARARPGSAILIRALNNDRSVRRFFEPAFRFDSVLGERLLARDRSLFYNRVEVAFRVSAPA